MSIYTGTFNAQPEAPLDSHKDSAKCVKCSAELFAVVQNGNVVREVCGSCGHAHEYVIPEARS